VDEELKYRYRKFDQGDLTYIVSRDLSHLVKIDVFFEFLCFDINWVLHFHLLPFLNHQELSTVYYVAIDFSWSSK
jgi:hypothetical protein